VKVRACAWNDDSASLVCECGHVFLPARPATGSSEAEDATELAAQIAHHEMTTHGEWVIICRGLAPGAHAPFAPAGQYLQDYRPDALGGYGSTGWTSDPGRAMRFASRAAAEQAWGTQSAVIPGRHPARMYRVEMIPAVFADLAPGIPPGPTQEGAP
jgi:hypothetical protein